MISPENIFRKFIPFEKQNSKVQGRIQNISTTTERNVRVPIKYF